jgi:heat shock protein HslJ
MVREIRYAAGLALLLSSILACSPSVSPGPSGGPSGTLVDTAWTVTTVNGTTVVPDAPPTMVFGADGMVSGTGGCNQYSGPYTTDGGSISVGDLASTLMLCEGDRGTHEAAFLAALDGAGTWRITPEGNLEIGGAGSIVASPGTQAPTPQSSPTDLPGTSWDLVEMGNTGDFARIVPTIEFGPDGRVSGFAACNTFSGTYTLDGVTIALGPLATTKMACQPPASVVEAEYLAALSGVATWSIEPDGSLVLGGPVPLRYARR